MATNDLDMGGKGRFYNPRSLAGGLTFKGSRNLENGLFGMDFEQPQYGLKDWRKKITFKFKKSVFFFENVLVCLGSDISAEETNGNVVQTTLFQDKLVDAVKSLIKIDGVPKRNSPTFSAVTPWSLDRNYTSLTDAKGNHYYIPNSSRTILKVHVENQISKTDNGKRKTSGHYGTAWFQHDKSSPEYEYAVLIPTTFNDSQLADDISTAQETVGSEIYKVLKKDSTAHVIQFLQSTQLAGSDLDFPLTGYVMFAAATSLPLDGPVEAVNEDNCLIMAEETEVTIYLSICSPDLNFHTKGGPLYGSKDVGVELLYQSLSNEREIDVTLKKTVETTTYDVKVHGKPDGYDAIVKVDDDGKIVRFLNLKNGFSVEVKLKKTKKNNIVS